MLVPFRIDLNEPFERLARAPVVEAVIEVRARAETEWTEEAILPWLKTALPEYSSSQSLTGFAVTIDTRPSEGASGAFGPQDLGWMGVRFESASPHRIAEFTRDHFFSSRLHPYQDWTDFHDEAKRLWEVHRRVAGIGSIGRLGVRFINRIEVPGAGEDFAAYLKGLGEPAVPLPLASFHHTETFVPTGYGYQVNLTRTVQPVAPDRAGLIIDIDVFTTGPTDPPMMDQCLAEMRWLKNTVFFRALTQKALELCR